MYKINYNMPFRIQPFSTDPQTESGMEDDGDLVLDGFSEHDNSASNSRTDAEPDIEIDLRPQDQDENEDRNDSSNDRISTPLDESTVYDPMDESADTLPAKAWIPRSSSPRSRSRSPSIQPAHTPASPSPSIYSDTEHGPNRFGYGSHSPSSSFREQDGDEGEPEDSIDITDSPHLRTESESDSDFVGSPPSAMNPERVTGAKRKRKQNATRRDEEEDDHEGDEEDAEEEETEGKRKTSRRPKKKAKGKNAKTKSKAKSKSISKMSTKERSALVQSMSVLLTALSKQGNTQPSVPDERKGSPMIGTDGRSPNIAVGAAHASHSPSLSRPRSAEWGTASPARPHPMSLQPGVHAPYRLPSEAGISAGRQSNVQNQSDRKSAFGNAPLQSQFDDPLVLSALNDFLMEGDAKSEKAPKRPSSVLPPGKPLTVDAWRELDLQEEQTEYPDFCFLCLCASDPRQSNNPHVANLETEFCGNFGEMDIVTLCGLIQNKYNKNCRRQISVESLQLPWWRSRIYLHFTKHKCYPVVQYDRDLRDTQMIMDEVRNTMRIPDPLTGDTTVCKDRLVNWIKLLEVKHKLIDKVRSSAGSSSSSSSSSFN